ncbi:hypothetical protein U9M48_039245 [Paspalum notatum var. saurae]
MASVTSRIFENATSSRRPAAQIVPAPHAIYLPHPWRTPALLPFLGASSTFLLRLHSKQQPRFLLLRAHLCSSSPAAGPQPPYTKAQQAGAQQQHPLLGSRLLRSAGGQRAPPTPVLQQPLPWRRPSLHLHGRLPLLGQAATGRIFPMAPLTTRSNPLCSSVPLPTNSTARCLDASPCLASKLQPCSHQRAASMEQDLPLLCGDACLVFDEMPGPRCSINSWMVLVSTTPFSCPSLALDGTVAAILLGIGSTHCFRSPPFRRCASCSLGVHQELGDLSRRLGSLDRTASPRVMLIGTASPLQGVNSFRHQPCPSSSPW